MIADDQYDKRAEAETAAREETESRMQAEWIAEEEQRFRAQAEQVAAEQEAIAAEKVRLLAIANEQTEKEREWKEAYKEQQEKIAKSRDEFEDDVAAFVAIWRTRLEAALSDGDMADVPIMMVGYYDLLMVAEGRIESDAITKKRHWLLNEFLPAYMDRIADPAIVAEAEARARKTLAEIRIERDRRQEGYE